MRVMELHSPVKLVQRSKGRTATAAAAYRSGTRIECERTGQTHDYTRKKGIELTSLLFPADAPDWALDRAALWNAAERREKHPRAQPAREVEMSFPAEFSAEQRREAGLAVGNLIVERYGVAADLCWHKPSRKGDERNHHLHVLFTTRRFENGDWAKNKDRTLDDLYGKGAEEIASLREGVAGVLNNIAARDRLSVYVEHLSFEKRGLGQEATQHMGPIATEMERRGVKTDIGEKNRDIQARNNERRQLHDKRKIVNIEIERERLAQKQKQQSPAPSLSIQQSRQTRPPDIYKAFYQETQERRLALLNELDRQYGPQERDARQELTQLYHSVSSKSGVVRFWRTLTGRTQKEKALIARLQLTLESIQERRQKAFDTFERNRQERLEALKKKEQQPSPANDFDKFAKASLANERAKMRQKATSRQQGLEHERD